MKIRINEEHWYVEYDGYGNVTFDNEKVVLEPKISTSENETHSALVLSYLQVKDFRIRITANTVEQLRENSVPKSWEVFWIFFNYNATENGNKETNYFILKPNGFEFGSAWGETEQCFVATNNEPILELDTEFEYDIVKSGLDIEIKIDRKIIYKNTVNSNDIFDCYGSIGLYTEDAKVAVSSVEFLTDNIA